MNAGSALRDALRHAAEEDDRAVSGVSVGAIRERLAFHGYAVLPIPEPGPFIEVRPLPADYGFTYCEGTWGEQQDGPCDVSWHVTGLLPSGTEIDATACSKHLARVIGRHLP